MLSDGHKYLKALLGLGLRQAESFTDTIPETIAVSSFEAKRKKMCPSVRWL
jgi:hypothetical protein